MKNKVQHTGVYTGDPLTHLPSSRLSSHLKFFYFQNKYDLALARADSGAFCGVTPNR